MNLSRTAARQWAGTVVRLVLAGIWAWAAISKIGDPRKFTQAVRAYDATPEWLSKGIGYGLPVLELSLAILLLLGLIVRYAAAVSAALFVVFIIGIAQASIRDIKLECGCFGGGGTSTSTTYTLDILRDVGLLVLAVLLIIWPMTRLSIDEYLIKSEMVVTLTPKQAKLEKNVRRYRAAVAAAEVELKHKQRYVAAGTAVVVLLVSLVAIGVQGGRAKITGSVNSANATATTGVTVGNPAAPVTVDLYEDLQCPICNQLEQSGLTTDFTSKIA
ncbi:MAG: DoxX family rane protein, partial [Frankiales bacterium]|nr:DoxX family rane protein [Frankiales bacterium]